MPDLPVAAPDPADLTERERVWLAVMPSWTDVSGRGIEEKVAALLAERQQDKQRIERLRDALDAIARNAEAWHGVPPETGPGAGQGRALRVAGEWARAALAVEEEATP